MDSNLHSREQKMMNILAICLVVSSLAAAGVWSPSRPGPDQKNEEVIVKEGHRVVVVEYDQEGQHNTKVSISPEHDYNKPKTASSNFEDQISTAASEALSSARDKIKEASSVLPNLGSKSYGEGHGPGDLMHDAHEKCKEDRADAYDKAKEIKDRVTEVAHDAAVQQKDMAHAAKDKVSDAIHKVIDEKKEIAHGAKEVILDAFGKAKETASQKAHDVKEGAKDLPAKAKYTAKDAKDVGKTIGSDIATNITQQIRKFGQNIMERTRGVKEFMGLKGLMGLVNLLGFATAYGMCVWVTFISSYVLAGALPRQQFGMVQSKIYSVYFKAMTSSMGLALLAHLSTKAPMFQGFNLFASLLMVLLNSIYLEPRATKVMFERMRVEKEEGRGRESIIAEALTAADPTAATTATATAEATTSVPERPEPEEVRSRITRLSERLKKLNTYSSILNILNLMSLTWYLVYLGQKLNKDC